jgi:hypothetical protein
MTDRERARELVSEGMCPFCDAGPFKVVALHTEAKHETSAFDLRQLLGYVTRRSICDPEYRSACSQRASEGFVNHVNHGTGDRNAARRETEASRRQLAERHAKAMTPEARIKAAAAKSRTDRARTLERDTRIVELRKQGWGAYRIAKAVDSTPSSVYRALRHYGKR